HLAPWEFADALMHARSRRGRHDHPYGRVFPFRGRLRPLPRTKPPMSADVTLLARPNLTELRRRDLSFSRVLESRRSVRAHGSQPINVRQLGEFLYRAARVQTKLQPKPPIRPYDASLRPSPSGGACHELELYVVVNRCSGLARGVYHYEPLRHALGRLDAGLDALDALLRDCPAPANAPAPWHLLIVITARFGRVNWKYRGMSYATVLKDVGALMQTMYLVATAMGLAPCALGGGDSERFARTIGTNYFEESSVGEFLIGTCARIRTARRRT
ncbi:MAG: SagB/ThcOx family dehydrogenase, partial [Steroidobacteraceae bacterium]